LDSSFMDSLQRGAMSFDHCKSSLNYPNYIKFAIYK
jgi:hypothetical protein